MPRRIGVETNVKSAILLFALLARAAPADEISPAWRRTYGEGVEWVEALERGGEAAFVVALRAGSPDRQDVQLLNAETGAALLPAPLQARGGVRLVRLGEGGDSARAASRATGSAPSTAETRFCYLHDRFGVYAIEWSAEAARIRWRAGDGPLSAQWGDDPEYLPRILDACATPGGVLVGDSRGRIALFSSESEWPRWKAKIGGAFQLRFEVCGGAAAVLWQAGGRAWAAFIDLNDPPRELSPIELKDGWPAQSRLDDGGLVLAWLERAGMLRRDGTLTYARFAGRHGGELPTIWIGDLERGGPSRTIFVIRIGPNLFGYDPPSGAWRWETACPVGNGVEPGAGRADGGQLLGGGRLAWIASGATVYDLRTGRVAALVDSGLWLRDSRIRDDELVYWDLVGESPEFGAAWQVGRMKWSRLETATAERGAWSGRPPWFPLRDSPRDAAPRLAGEMFLLANSAGMAAYRLPPAEPARN